MEPASSIDQNLTAWESFRQGIFQTDKIKNLINLSSTTPNKKKITGDSKK